MAYSPERINPGDRVHRLETITKIVAAEDAVTLERTAAVYGRVIEAGLYRAPSIRVAEAAKVIENTQRDLNIALVNELAIIFDRLGIRTSEVLEAAGTKWNFLRFSPGLVGGHCIGIDPYYLTAKAEQVGYHPEVILAGRRINDGMGNFVAQKVVKLLAATDLGSKGARVAILGVTFKENVADIRNSRVPDIVQGLEEFGLVAVGARSHRRPRAHQARVRRRAGAVGGAPRRRRDGVRGAASLVPRASARRPAGAAQAGRRRRRRQVRPHPGGDPAGHHLLEPVMNVYARICDDLSHHPRRFLVTGVAGFIGSHLLERLLVLGQDVVGLDNFETGRRQNLADVRARVGEEAWSRFSLIEGDIADADTAAHAVEGADVVLHQAALGSVPRSIADPMRTHRANIDGFLTMLLAARDAAVGRFVYASSSSVYGDHPGLPKVEAETGRPLSPYATTKVVDELYADVVARTYGTTVVGLRYFNVFGPRQDPDGPYAAVIPRWIGELLAGKRPTIHGDGATTRDFCFVDNAVQANLLAATTTDGEALNQAYNVAVGERTSLNELFRLIRDGLASRTGSSRLAALEPVYDDFRPGDVQHSLADVGKAVRRLGYRPDFTLPEGLDVTLDDVVARLDRAGG